MAEFLRKDRPTLTAMLAAHTPAQVIDAAPKGLAGGTDAFGFSMEIFPDQYHTREALLPLFSELGGKPFYITNYGWHKPDVPDEVLGDELVMAVETAFAAGCAAVLADMPGDMFDRNPRQMTENPEALAKQRALIDRLHAAGAEVAVSSHVMKYLPESEVLELFRLQREHGADICKAVTKADTEDELNENFRISSRIHALPRPAIFVCSGACSRRHRHFAPLLSNSVWLCVPEQNERTTKEQPELATARNILREANLL